MDKVSLQVPASLSEFSASSDGRTIAKLKMFYVGETADGRVFDKQFADKLVESLPYCPIVGFFSDIQDDFLGHNSKQYIYGIVKPDAEYGYEKDNEGKDWLVTEVMLYTDRPDNTGDIAKKIVGKPHSLELNPNNVKYEVFSENGKRKIRFTEGSLIGLSVLGTNQKPAFTGSEFFMASDFSDMRERFDNFFSFLENNGRGEQTMDNKTQFESYVNFVKLSYTEKMRKAESTLQEQLGDRFSVVIEDMDDNSFVAGKLDFESWNISHSKYDYQLTDAEFTISNERAAFRKYLTVEELNYLESFGTQTPSKEEEEKEEEKPEQASAAPVEEEEKEEQCSAPTEEEEVEDKEEKEEEKQEDMAAKEEETDEPQPEEKEEEEEVAKAQDINEEEEDEEEKDEPSKEDEDDKEFSQHTSTLSDSERQELEVFRRQAKERLINEYEGLLDKELLADFTNRVNEYDYNALEAALAIAFSKHTRTNKTVSREIPLSFGNLQTADNEADHSYAGLVKRILNK